jgi:hypothetical protein
VPWDELGETDREADRRIGEAVVRARHPLHVVTADASIETRAKGVEETLRAAGVGLLEAYERGRRDGIAAAAEWLNDRAKETENEVDDECDGQDADRFCAEAGLLRKTSKAMAAWGQS